MRLMHLAAAGGNIPNQVTRTFTSADTSFTVPGGVTLLTNASGYGAGGTEEYDDTVVHVSWDSYSQRSYFYTDGSSSSDAPVFTGSGTGSHPAPHCTGMVVTGVPGTEGLADCYSYVDTSTTTGRFHPQTTGASATGFGLTFPGGDGGPASTTTFTNVTVSPGSYALSIPSGGSITIIYFV